MQAQNNSSKAKCIHIVTLNCKDSEHAKQCLNALANYGKPDALSFNCSSYDFGLKAGTEDTIYIVESWFAWADLDSLLHAKVIPALPMFNQLLKNPFNPGTDTLRIELAEG
jgi:hypothetical protein